MGKKDNEKRRLDNTSSPYVQKCTLTWELQSDACEPQLLVIIGPAVCTANATLFDIDDAEPVHLDPGKNPKTVGWEL